MKMSFHKHENAFSQTNYEDTVCVESQENTEHTREPL